MTAKSSFYETEPMETPEKQPWFLNCAVELRTEKLPKQLLSAVLRIEREMGRKRSIDKGPRVIDIDILLFGLSIIDTPQLEDHAGIARSALRYADEILIPCAPSPIEINRTTPVRDEIAEIASVRVQPARSASPYPE